MVRPPPGPSGSSKLKKKSQKTQQKQQKKPQPPPPPATREREERLEAPRGAPAVPSRWSPTRPGLSGCCGGVTASKSQVRAGNEALLTKAGPRMLLSIPLLPIRRQKSSFLYFFFSPQPGSISRAAAPRRKSGFGVGLSR